MNNQLSKKTDIQNNLSETIPDNGFHTVLLQMLLYSEKKLKLMNRKYISG